MRKTIAATAVLAGLGFAAAAAAQSAQPPYGQIPAGGQMVAPGQMMPQGQMMTSQNMMMNDPEMRRHMAEMARGCSHMMQQMGDRRAIQRRDR